MLEKTNIIFLDELKQAFRDKKVLAIIFTYVVLLWLGIKYASIFKIIAQLFYFSSVLDTSIILPFYVSAFLIPLLALLLAYDSISAERQENSIRFLASRIDRSSILLGKFLAAAILLISINFISYFALALNEFFSSNQWLMKDFMLAFSFLSVYSLCFLSIGFLASTITKKPSTSLWVALTINSTLTLLLITNLLEFINPLHYIGKFLKGTYTGFYILGSYTIIIYIITNIILKRMDL